jgi:hypothetical protein
LYGCEIWFLILREEDRLREFEKSVLKRIFELMREEVAGGWKRVHEELYSLYASPIIIWVINLRRTRLAEHVARMGELRHAYSILVGKLEGKRSLKDLDVDGKIILEWIFGKSVTA